MKKILFLAVFFIFCLANMNIVHSQPYHYPVLPGDDLWKKQKSFTEKVKLCSIPENILKSMSTNDLLITVFNFPFSRYLILTDNFLDYFNHIRKIYNGIDELISRKDAATVLYERYVRSDSYNSLGQEIFLENFLSFPVMLTALEDSQKKILMDSCLQKFSRRVDSKYFLAYTAMVSNSFLQIRLLSFLDNAKYKSLIENNEDIRKFSETSAYPNKHTVNNIISEIIRNKEK